MIGRHEERVDTQSMITHARMIEQTMIIERKTTTQPNMMVKDKRICANGNKFTAK